VARLGKNFQIKRLKLQGYSFINGSIDLSEMNLLGSFSGMAEFAVKIPKIYPIRQFFIALSLYVFVDFMSD
jgi:hypothetical protein